MLIAINGPIASGKSTIARAVARDLHLRGVTAAVIDLDLLYDMLHHDATPKGDDRTWHVARSGGAALADAFFEASLDTVIVEGRLFEDERAAFVGHLKTRVDPTFVSLRVSYETALRRALADPTRGVSRDPAFLRPYFRSVERDMATLPTSDLIIDTEHVGVTESVAIILAFTRLQADRRGTLAV